MEINHACVNYGQPEYGCPSDGNCQGCSYYGPVTATFANGIKAINVTPHDLTFEENGEKITVPTSGIVINARAKEAVVKNGTPTLVRTSFVSSEEDIKKLEELERDYPGIIPIGSIIAAQAFPGRVFGMTPMPGFERVHPSEKRMNPDKFTTF